MKDHISNVHAIDPEDSLETQPEPAAAAVPQDHDLPAAPEVTLQESSVVEEDSRTLEVAEAVAELGRDDMYQSKLRL